MIWTCNKLAKLYPDDFPGCCTSCHEDEAEGYYELIDKEMGGHEVYICCYVMTWLEEDDGAILKKLPKER